MKVLHSCHKWRLSGVYIDEQRNLSLPPAMEEAPNSIEVE